MNLVMINVNNDWDSKTDLNVNNKSLNLSHFVIWFVIELKNAAFPRRLLTTQWAGVDSQKQQVL